MMMVVVVDDVVLEYNQTEEQASLIYIHSTYCTLASDKR